MSFRHVKQMLQGRGYWEESKVDGGNSGGAGGGDDAAKVAAAAAAAAADLAAADAEAKRLAALGSNKPTDAEAALLREVMDKKDKIKTAADALAAANAKLKEFEGLDPKELRELVAAKKTAETAALEARGAWDSLKSQMVDAHTKELQAERDGKTAAETRAVELASQIAELTVGNAFGASSYIAKELELSVSKARRIYGDHFEYVDGAVVAYDKPAGAKSRNVLVDSKGEPLTFEVAIAKLVELDPDKESMLKSKLRMGAGSHTNPAVVPGAKPGAGSVGTGRAKIAAGLAKSGLK
jgi:hypothetical protein